MGGGERLLLEGVQRYRELGYRTLIYTWFFDPEALFSGKYENKDIHVLSTKEVSRSNILGRALSRVRTLRKLRKSLHENAVSNVFVQGEYDVALVFLTSLFTKVRYRFLIFGQIFQYPHDHGKYSFFFRRHLRRIVESRPGYRETISLNPPKLSLLNRMANELICLARLAAVRGAEKRFAFSEQIRWETNLLFARDANIAAGAFPLSLLTRDDFNSQPLDYLGLKAGEYILSLSRLDRKKRIDLIIDAFAKCDTDKTLVIAGAGPDEAYLRERAMQSTAVDRIRFVGLVAEADMLPLKHFAALFVSMDVGDFDISPLEALAVGTPALCPTDFDADFRLESISGFRRVEPNVEDVAAAIKDFLVEPTTVSRQELTPWSWERYFDTLLED
jgi:glycosyltransferase involved in cell wall biosynthesis